MNRITLIVLLTVVPSASAQSGGTYDLSWNSVDGGGGTSVGGTFALHGSVGQPDAGDLAGGTFTLSGGFWAVAASDVVSCAGATDCADLDTNGIRDDNCIWWECAADSCHETPLTQFADMGSPFGACPPDQFANIHDRNHALSCFAGTNPCDPINIDAGGAFGACQPDGFCNIHDANHALASFAGTSTCSCPSGPMPEFGPDVVGHATIGAALNHRTIAPGSEVRVQVFLEGPVHALRSYQLEAVVSGGAAGTMTLMSIDVEQRKDDVFGDRSDAFDAYNPDGRMLRGLDENDGVAVKEAYLATFTYGASKDASGMFVIDLATGPNGQTYLVAPGDGMIEIVETVPALVSVAKGR